MRRYQVVVTAAILVASVSACGGDEKPVGDSTVAVSAAASDSSSKNAKDGAAAGRPCLVDHKPGACQNVLAEDWAARSPKQIFDTLTQMTWVRGTALPAPRLASRSQCPGALPTQTLRPARDAKNMDDNLANWKVGVTVAMAKFVVEDKGKCDDEVYGVGNKRKNRAYFLLFTVDTIRTTPANVDVTLGQWAVVSFDSTDLNVRPDTVSTGFYRRCASPHVHVGSLSLAGFKTCQLKHELMMAADSAGVSFETAQLLFDSLANKAKPSDNTQAQSALEKSLSTLVRLARGDEPAWTTCALGCCVSENPTRRNGANARANKSAVAPQSTRRRLDESAFAPANRSRKAL